MSRNLGQTSCYFCDGSVVADEAPRVGTAADFHDAKEYLGMVVAHGTCVECLAKYLIWLRCDVGANFLARPATFRDLSFRSTFDDEPGEEDMPKFRIVTRRLRMPAETPPTGVSEDSLSTWQRHFREHPTKPRAIDRVEIEKAKAVVDERKRIERL